MPVQDDGDKGHRDREQPSKDTLPKLPSKLCGTSVANPMPTMIRMAAMNIRKRAPRISTTDKTREAVRDTYFLRFCIIGCATTPRPEQSLQPRRAHDAILSVPAIEMITRCTVKSNSPSTKRAAHSHVLLSASGHAKSPIHTALLFMSQSVIGSSVGLVPTNAPAVTDQFAGERPTRDLPFPNQAQLCSTRRRVSPG